MKKILCIFTAAMCLALTACFGGSNTPMEKIQKRLNEMEGYKCTADLTRITNKGESKYGIEQYCKMSGEYKLVITEPDNLKGNYTVYDGSRICQYSASAGGKVVSDASEAQARNELFLSCFVKNYMQSEEVSVDVAVMDESKCTVLEASIPGGNKFTATERLWVDNETLDPVRLTIYDTDGKERYIIDYNEFKYNCEFEAETFDIGQ